MTDRVVLDGKFFRHQAGRFTVRGVTYGAFAPNTAGEPFPDPGQVARDFDQIADLGANTVRIYDVPAPWFLDAAAEHGLRLFVSLPWRQNSCLLETRGRRREARTAILAAVQSMAAHPALFAVALGNEIPPDILRWCGADTLARFLDDLVDAVHQVDPGCLCTYGNFPPTEFLQPQRLDFITFNLFLHSQPDLARYLRHLHLHAEGKPLVLGECGVDALREGPERQAAILDWTLDTARQGGLAGAIIFAYTDDWVHAGRRVSDWALGLTTADRQPRPAFAAVRARFLETPPLPARTPRVSVVVATYNGAATLRGCLEALLQQTYPNYEVIVIDDGSTDGTPDITTQLQQVRTLRLRANAGLSNARNLGIRAATGDIIAFTDDDCRPDQDWIRLLVERLLDDSVAGAGGPNLLPPDDGPLAAIVAAAPGGPHHVLLEADIAEHVPGCNMAFWRWALDALQGFDPRFHRAGDDVDVCWRLQRRGWRIGFAPAAFVWHHRRATISSYLRQQAGYGEAEALLQAKHPAQFNLLGNARWQGRLSHPTDGDSAWRRTLIHRGTFATGLFQVAYVAPATGLRALCTSLEFHLLVALPLVILTFLAPWLWPLTALALLLPPSLCLGAAWRAPLHRYPSPPGSRLLLALLAYLQPLARGAARLRTRLGREPQPRQPELSLAAQARAYSAVRADQRTYLSPAWRDRREWVEAIVAHLEHHGWNCRADAGWSDFDLEIPGSRWTRLTLTTAGEFAHDGSYLLRCRLRPHWTLFAHLAVWGALAAELAIIGLAEVTWKGWWIPPATVAGFTLFLRHQARMLQVTLGVLLDELAQDLGLTPLESGASTPSPAPGSAP